MRWRKRSSEFSDKNYHSTNIGALNHTKKPESKLDPQSFPEKEHLKVITDLDAQVMNEKIKPAYNNRDSILQTLEGNTVRITALNIDIVNSSVKVKTLSSEQVGEYYQTFIESTSDLIQDYGGYILKNVGDCVIGFFPDIKHMIKNHENAVLCGLAVSDMLKDSLNPYLAERKMPAIECRISADFGPVKVLRIRSKVYSVIDLFGSVMNSVTKISYYAKPSQMVIGDDLFWQLIHNDGFEFKMLNRIDLSGNYSYPIYVVRRK